MAIVVFLSNKDFAYYPGQPGLGKRLAFWDDLFDRQKSTNPQDPLPPILGEHSGDATVIRFEGGGQWVQYTATYRLSKNYADSQKSPPVLAADPTVDQDPSSTVKKGQITAQGLVFFKDGDFVGSPKVAVTGGTEEYKNARGQVTWERADPCNRHTLDII